MSEIKYEYEQILLTGDESKFVNIPLSLILNTDMDEKRIGVFAYLKMCSGLDDVSRFIVSNMVEWCGYKSDIRRVGGTNDRFLDIVDEFAAAGYLVRLTDKSRTKYMEYKINEKYCSLECAEGYATIYLDELKKILTYKRRDANDVYIKNTVVLLVFAYLRYKIPRRPNKLNIEERSLDKIKDRKQRLPEAYDCHIMDIANELCLSDRAVSVAINILETELGLIVRGVAYKIKDKNGEYRTLNSIFVNAYKREGSYLLVSGEIYSMSEIECKAEKLKKFYGNYIINKDK